MHVFPDCKVYVGLTKQRCEARWGLNGNGYKKQPVYSAIQFYGWDNIDHIIVKTNMDVVEAKQLEKQLIQKYDSINNGWNISTGGSTGGKACETIKYKGKNYSSEEILQFSSVENLTSHDITTRLSHGWDIEKILNKKKQSRNSKYEYKNIYYTVKQLVKFIQEPTIDYNILRCRLEKGWDTERALTQSVGVKKQPYGLGERIYEYNGKMYNSYELSQINPELGLTSSDITGRINCKKWTVEKAISQPKKKMNYEFEYNGKYYNSHELAEICIDPSMTYHDVTDRYRDGWSVWEIVNIPKGTTRKKYYKK